MFENKEQPQRTWTLIVSFKVLNWSSTPNPTFLRSSLPLKNQIHRSSSEEKFKPNKRKNSSNSSTKLFFSSTKMQRIRQKQAVQQQQEPARSSSLAGESMEGNRGQKNRYVSSSSPSPRPRPACTCSNRPGSVSCISHGYAVPAGEKLRRNNNASKEVLRRALAPPIRRLSLRWLNFRPKPSRLSNMSVA